MASSRDTLLIGGNGFFGSAMAHALVLAGHRVHVASRHAAPGRRDGIVFHRGGQDNPSVIAPLLRQCQTVIHLASTTTPGSSARRPHVDVEDNLLPAAALLELMATAPPQRLVFVSSGGAIYGNPAQIPVDEATAPQPLSYHAAGKLALESLFAVFAHANKVPLAILRPSNLYGPGQALRHGFGFARTLLEKARRHEPIEIWGNGSAIRDYLYIDDAVEGCLSLLALQDAGGVFNLGSGVGTSITEMIAVVERVIGRRLTISKRPARGTDVQAILLDSSRLTKASGWQPRTELQDGLLRTWEWVRNSTQ